MKRFLVGFGVLALLVCFLAGPEILANVVYITGAGGGSLSSGGASLPVVDTTSIVEGSGDNSKEIRFEVDGITTGAVRVITPPDSNTTLPIASQIITFAGPTAARTYTFPDAAATIARTDAGQTFTGGAAGNTFTGTDHDTVKVTSATGAIRTGVYIRSSSSTGINGVWVDNDRGSLASYTTVQQGATGSVTTLFGASAADASVIVAAGASLTRMMIGTNTADPVILGTGDVNRITLGATGSLGLERTVTAGGTTGAQTIDKMAGTVNLAGAATTLVVTNALVSSTSIVFCTRRTADTTCMLASCESGAGSFTVRMTAACAAETSVGFLVTN